MEELYIYIFTIIFTFIFRVSTCVESLPRDIIYKIVLLMWWKQHKKKEGKITFLKKTFLKKKRKRKKAPANSHAFSHFLLKLLKRKDQQRLSQLFKTTLFCLENFGSWFWMFLKLENINKQVFYMFLSSIFKNSKNQIDLIALKRKLP